MSGRSPPSPSTSGSSGLLMAPTLGVLSLSLCSAKCPALGPFLYRLEVAIITIYTLRYALKRQEVFGMWPRLDHAASSTGSSSALFLLLQIPLRLEASVPLLCCFPTSRVSYEVEGIS
uniref:Putative secreted protein n=1 Tax=Anopheles marajoara TaxID=58244 RepID=A0A2M4C8I2_9DIPT